MSAVQAIRLVATREFTERVRDKSFAIGVVVTVLFIAGFVLVPDLLGFDDPDEYTVVVVDDAGENLARAVAAQAEQSGEATVEVQRVPDLAAAEAALRDDDDATVALAPGADGQVGELVVRERLEQDLGPLLQAASGRVRVTEELGRAGIPPEQVEGLLAPPPLPVRELEPNPGAAGVGVVIFVIVVLYGQLFGFGLTVASGIVEEKSSRVVEVVLSTIRPVHLLAGKVLGIGAVGLFQLVLMAVTGIGLVLVTGLADVPTGVYRAALLAVVWFVLGYFLYACAFAVVGALVSRQEELQNASTPLTMLILGSMFLGYAAVFDPSSVVARVGSFFPLSAPIVMPVRMTADTLPLWEVALSVGLLLSATVATVLLAGRVYQTGALRTTGRVKIREALEGA